MKLSPFTILSIGLMIFIIGFSFGCFRMYMPNTKDAQLYRDWTAQLQAEADKMPQAKQRVEKAKERVEAASDEWQAVVARRTPAKSVAGGGIDLTVDRYNLTVDARSFRDSVQRAVNRHVKMGGVTVVQGPYVVDPPEDPATIMSAYFNYPPMVHPVAIFDLGQVTVQGTFDQIEQNVRNWSNMKNFLAVADGLTITGTSPRLTATYNVTVVAFIRGKEVAPDVTAVGAAAAQAQPAGIGRPSIGGGGGPAAAAAAGSPEDR
ncbi:hypothetical protein QPK87_10110 [Kamptonema cortianum]|nr:hypothetical protein [Kamptonema cortianum]